MLFCGHLRQNLIIEQTVLRVSYRNIFNLKKVLHGRILPQAFLHLENYGIMSYLRKQEQVFLLKIKTH